MGYWLQGTGLLAEEQTGICNQILTCLPGGGEGSIWKLRHKAVMTVGQPFARIEHPVCGRVGQRCWAGSTARVAINLEIASSQ